MEIESIKEHECMEFMVMVYGLSSGFGYRSWSLESKLITMTLNQIQRL